MAVLKSAWEIALEKTEGITTDPQKVREDDLRTKGRRLAGAFLAEDNNEASTLEREYFKHTEQERLLIREGFVTTILMNLTLPQYSDYEIRFEKLTTLAALISSAESSAPSIMQQIKNFFDNYLLSRDNLVERAKQQYLPIFEEKQQRMAQNYGGSGQMSLENDPDFINLIQSGYQQLNRQYQQALDQAKEQLEAEWSS